MTDLEEETDKVLEHLSSGVFEIAGEDQLAKLRQEYKTAPGSDEERKRLTASWDSVLRDIKIRMGTLLKTDHLSFLFGAGVSKAASGVLLGKVPLEIEKALLDTGIFGSRVRRWLSVFYLATRRLAPNPADLPLDQQGILKGGRRSRKRWQTLTRRKRAPARSPLPSRIYCHYYAGGTSFWRGRTLDCGSTEHPRSL